MNELAADSDLTKELESGRLPLSRVRELGLRDILRQQNPPVVIRGNPVLR